MMYVRTWVRTYIRTYVSVALRNVAVTSRRNVANQRSYVILLCGRRVEPGNIHRRPWTSERGLCVGNGAGWMRRWMERGLQPWWWRRTL